MSRMISDYWWVRQGQQLIDRFDCSCGTHRSQYLYLVSRITFIVALSITVTAGVAAADEPLAQNDSAVSDAPISADIIGQKGAPKTPRHDIPPQTFHRLWSNEPNGAYSNATTNMGKLRSKTDTPFQDPPTIASRWNGYEADAGRFPTRLNSSNELLYPPNSSTISSTSGPDGMELKGYVSIVDITPSTKLHVAPNTTLNYVGTDGTVMAIRDYMYDPPPLGTYFNCGDKCRYSYSSPKSNAGDVSLLGDFESVGDSSSTQPLEIPYNGFKIGGQTIGVEARYTAQVTKNFEELVCVEEDDEGNCEEYEWKDAGSETIDIDLTTDTKTDVDRYNPTYGEIDTFKFPDGSMAVTVSSTQEWHSINPPIADKAYGVWRYYTARDTSWDTFKYKNTDGESATFHSPVKPLRVHGYPDTDGVEVESTADVHFNTLAIDSVGTKNGNSSAPDYDAPSLPDTVDVGVFENPYHTASTMTVRYADPSGADTANFSGYRKCVDDLNRPDFWNRAQICGTPPNTPDELTIEGVVPGNNYTVDVSETDIIEVGRPQIDYTITKTTAGKQHLKIDLDIGERVDRTVEQQVDIRDAPDSMDAQEAKYIRRDGRVVDVIPKDQPTPEPPVETTFVGSEPLDTTKHEDAYLVVNDQRFNTNGSGEIIIETPREPINVKYSPPPYYAAPSIATIADKQFVQPEANFDGVFDTLYALMWAVFLLFLPLWWIDEIFGSNWWPPWQDHKYWK